MKNILPKLLLLIMLLSFVLLFVLLHTTTPASAGAVGILGVFILAYALVVAVLSFFMYGVSRVIVKLSRLITVRKPIESVTFKRAYYYSSVIGLAPVIVISMQSVGSFGMYEFALVALLVVIGCIYVTKRTA